MLSIWRFICDLGATAVTVPLALVMLCSLAATRQPCLAIGWATAVLGCTGVISGLKLVLSTCGNLLAGAGLVSPSGHTAMSAVVYGGFAAVIGARLARPARAALIAGAAALIIAMPLSRLVLHVHTLIEVVVGLVVGLAALATIVSIAAIRRERLPVLWLAATAILVAILFHGERWPAERAIQHIAGWFDMLRPWCG